MKEIIKNLNSIKGLKVLSSLGEEHKEFIKKFEDKRNHGVMEALNRDFTLLLAHDETFREPESEIVTLKDNEILFPPVPFSEIKAKNVISSSPSKKVHDLLKQKLNLHIDENHATLLVGFDI